MIHALITLIGIGICWFTIHNAIYPAIFFVGWFVSREQTQAEYRYIEKYAGGLRANMSFYAWLEPKAWTLKSLFDFILPIAVAVVCVILLN